MTNKTLKADEYMRSKLTAEYSEEPIVSTSDSSNTPVLNTKVKKKPK